MEKHWYVLQYKPNAHIVATKNLHRLGFETFLPMQEVTNRKCSRFVRIRRPLFPGYLFVKFDLSLPSWRIIKGTIGVIRLLSNDGVPSPVPKDLITGLQLRCDKSGTLNAEKNLSTGDKINLINGPFANFSATVEKIEGNQRVWLLMEIMGHKARLKVGDDQSQFSHQRI